MQVHMEPESRPDPERIPEKQASVLAEPASGSGEAASVPLHLGRGLGIAQGGHPG